MSKPETKQELIDHLKDMINGEIGHGFPDMDIIESLECDLYHLEAADLILAKHNIEIHEKAAQELCDRDQSGWLKH